MVQGLADLPGMGMLVEGAGKHHRDWVQGVRRLRHVCLAVHNCSTVVHLPCGTTISSCSSSGVEGSAGLMPSGTLMTGRVAVAYWPCPSNVGATAVGAASKRCLAWHACFEENTERECGQSATM